MKLPQYSRSTELDSVPFWTKRAFQNLDSILGRIADDDPPTAKRIAGTIKATASRLDQYPQMGKPGAVEGTRELIFPSLPYVLVYRVSRRVEILRLLHTRQQWPQST
ncbi:type II toxin-antitoxin system RelE/ParE family toxin [Pseudodesulfovibrio alkaliphilus]|nr:type II toxin-antitoxin system RelE/ParE family toxin [Pseudodesulfovibrio alkaliphilus]